MDPQPPVRFVIVTPNPGRMWHIHGLISSGICGDRLSFANPDHKPVTWDSLTRGRAALNYQVLVLFAECATPQERDALLRQIEYQQVNNKPVAVLTSYRDAIFCARVMEAGASACIYYIPPEINYMTPLSSIVLMLHEGGKYADPAFIEDLPKTLFPSEPHDEYIDVRPTRAELRILKWMGIDVEEKNLYPTFVEVEHNTTKTHVSNLFVKFRVRSRHALVMAAISCGYGRYLQEGWRHAHPERGENQM